MDWIADDGVAGQGCMELGDAFNNGGTVGAYQEVPVAGDTAYQLRAWGRVPAGSAAQNVVVYATWYDAGGFRIADSQTFFGSTPWTGDWLELGGEVTSYANAVTAEVKVAVALAPSGADESVVRFDDVYFGLPGGSSDLFADGFESGETTAWSATVSP